MSISDEPRRRSNRKAYSLERDGACVAFVGEAHRSEMYCYSKRNYYLCEVLLWRILPPFRRGWHRIDK